MESPSLPHISYLEQTSLETLHFWRSLGSNTATFEPTADTDYLDVEPSFPGLVADHAAPVLIDALRSNSSNDIHAALNTLLTIDRTWQELDENKDFSAGPDTYLAVPLRTWANAQGAIQEVLLSSDELAGIKALRFVCNQAAKGSYDASYMLSGNIYKIISPPDSKDKELQREWKALRRDLLDAMTTDNATDVFLRSFLRGIGFRDLDAEYKFKSAWNNNGETKEQKREWRRSNLERMMELEQLQPGLSTKLNETFRTKNFARNSAKMQLDMYQDRVDHPERNYLLRLVAEGDHNFAFSDLEGDERIFYKLKEMGLGYEAHEFGDMSDLDHATQQARIRSSKGGQITDLTLSGHGSQESILAKNGIKIDAFNLRYLRPLEACLLSDALVFLDSCSTGKLEDGKVTIAERIRKLLSRKVVAPNKAIGSNVVIEADGRIKPISTAKEKRPTLAKAGRIAIVGSMVPITAIAGIMGTNEIFEGRPFTQVTFGVIVSCYAAMAGIITYLKMNRRSYDKRSQGHLTVLPHPSTEANSKTN